jgi:hypothetical protein
LAQGLAIIRLALKVAQHDSPDRQSAQLGAAVREIGSFLQLGLQHTWSLLKNVDKPQG